MGKDKDSNPKALWERFYKAVMKFEWDNALEMTNKLKELEPKNSQVYVKIGDVLQRTGDKPGAVSAYHQAADFMADVVNRQKALAIYKLILRLSPDDKKAIKKSQDIIGTMKPDSAEAKKTEPASPAARPKDIEEAFSKHQVFSALGKDDVQSLPERAKRLSFKDGEAVINEGDTSDSVFIIKEGKARVTTEMFGKTYHLATLSKWDFFGEIGFLTGMARTATVSSDGPLEVMEINRKLLEELLEKNPQILDRLVDISRARTQETVDTIKLTDASQE
jgi:tetratricopeptide (TPR) repeat protein